LIRLVAKLELGDEFRSELEENKFMLEERLRQHTKTRNGIFDILALGALKGE
jgi:hypothetical protein